VPLKVLNTLLGGYYGSRLMTSIREEKAYTYGIFSSHTVYRNASYIDIETQTDIRFVKPLIAAVYEEIERLQNEKVSEKELSILRQYLSGEFARMMDGPFTLSDLYISTASVGMPLSSLETQMQAMKEVSADDLQTLAQRYLRKASAYEVCVGGKSL
ncbi:MAG: insulinase family protein, partial [Bacteroidales bacterium]|nr:insulinase family protein [Bacteroidales bacterium]